MIINVHYAYILVKMIWGHYCFQRVTLRHFNKYGLGTLDMFLNNDTGVFNMCGYIVALFMLNHLLEIDTGHSILHLESDILTFTESPCIYHSYSQKAKGQRNVGICVIWPPLLITYTYYYSIRYGTNLVNSVKEQAYVMQLE